MFKIIAFDLDGTIANTIPMCIRAVKNAVSPYIGYDLKDQDVIDTFGLNEVGMIKALVSTNWELALEDFYLQYEHLHTDEVKVFSGILNLINFLKNKGTMLALITGKGERSCTISLEKFGISDVFDEILYGSEVSPNKIENIEYLLKQYNCLKENFCYIGDTIQDILVCKQVGVMCLSAAWKKNANIISLEKENPCYVFKRVQDLYNYFKLL